MGLFVRRRPMAPAFPGRQLKLLVRNSSPVVDSTGVEIGFS